VGQLLQHAPVLQLGSSPGVDLQHLFQLNDSGLNRGQTPPPVDPAVQASPTAPPPPPGAVSSGCEDQVGPLARLSREAQVARLHQQQQQPAGMSRGCSLVGPPPNAQRLSLNPAAAAAGSKRRRRQSLCNSNALIAPQHPTTAAGAQGDARQDSTTPQEKQDMHAQHPQQHQDVKELTSIAQLFAMESGVSEGPPALPPPPVPAGAGHQAAEAQGMIVLWPPAAPPSAVAAASDALHSHVTSAGEPAMHQGCGRADLTRAGAHSRVFPVAPVFVFDSGTQAAKAELERHKQQHGSASGLQWSCVNDRQLPE
jgi:hypothetical protein